MFRVISASISAITVFKFTLVGHKLFRLPELMKTKQPPNALHPTANRWRRLAAGERGR